MNSDPDDNHRICFDKYHVFQRIAVATFAYSTKQKPANHQSDECTAHFGCSAVENLKEAIRYYETVPGLTSYSIEKVADQKVRTGFS